MGILGSVLGIVVLLVIAVLFSNNRKAINLRTVLGLWRSKSDLRPLFCMCRMAVMHYKRQQMECQMLLRMVTKGLISSLVD